MRRPYDIGDRIALSNPDTPLSTDGSATWFVQTVGLFSTTVRFAATNEVATLANGSLASSRVINAKRSPQANVYVYMKFSVDVPYSKVMIFKRCVESFVKERPREWIGEFKLVRRSTLMLQTAIVLKLSFLKLNSLEWISRYSRRTRCRIHRVHCLSRSP